MAELGLTEEALAEKLDAPLETVRGWLYEGSLPRPARVRPLGVALGLSFDEMLGIVPVEAPSLVFHADRGVPKDAVALLQESASQILCSFAAQCKRPSRTPSFAKSGSPAERAMTVATTVRAQVGALSGRPLTIAELASLLKKQGVVVVPTPGRAPDEGLPPAVTIECAQENAIFVLANLGVTTSRLAWGLARAYAHVLAFRNLNDEALEEFCGQLANYLAPAGDDAFASALEEICGSAQPGGQAFIVRTEAVFATCFFELIQDWQDAEGGRNPAFFWNVLCCNLFDAAELTKVLWARRHPESALNRAD